MVLYPFFPHLIQMVLKQGSLLVAPFVVFLNYFFIFHEQQAMLAFTLQVLECLMT